MTAPGVNVCAAMTCAHSTGLTMPGWPTRPGSGSTGCFAVSLPRSQLV